MTLGILVVGWLGVAILVSPRVSGPLWGLRPRAQVAALLLAISGLAALPAAAAIYVLAEALAASGSGDLLGRCGRLLEGVLAHPWARPQLSAALVLLPLELAALAVGAASAWRSQSASRSLIRGRRGNRLVVPSRESFAFTAGYLRPRVVMSEGLLVSFPQAWRQVILAHEEAHRRGRHPLLILFAESLARGIPLPPMRWGAGALRLALEAIADDHASDKSGDRELVAEAVAGVALASMGSPGFEGNEVRRVRRLLAPCQAPPRSVTVFVVSPLVALVLFAGGHGLHCGEASIEALRVRQCQLR